MHVGSARQRIAVFLTVMRHLAGSPGVDFREAVGHAQN
jgi:hypothetical protein